MFESARESIFSAEITLNNLSNKVDYTRIKSYINELKTSMFNNPIEPMHNDFKVN